MSLRSADDFSFVLALLAFLSGVLLLESLLLLWQSWRGPRTKKLAARLHNLVDNNEAGVTLRLEKKSMLAALPGAAHLLRIFPRLPALEGWILQSGSDWSAWRLFTLSLLWSLLAPVSLVLSTQLPWFMIAGLTLGAAALPALYLRRKRAQRLAKLALQLPQTLDFLVRNMRSGHSLANGLQLIAEKMPEPVAGEFRIVRDEISFGVSLQQALGNLSQRVPNPDLHYFVIALLIHRDIGGKLAEILENLSKLLRERQKFSDKVKVLTAESQLTVWVLALLPFILAVLLSLFNPQFMAPLWNDPIGARIIKTGLVLMAIGLLLLRKIVRIRV